MKKYLLSAICFLFLSSNAHALDLSRVKTWAASEILTAADLNGEFNNILNHSLTNNDIDAAAGIVGSKLDLSAPGIIGATTPAAATYTTLTINSTSIFKDKMSFTQTDNLEYIDSLADGYLDFEATTGLRWRINATEQINLTDGLLAPTTDDDIDLGSTTKEFKDLWIDGTANIDSLVADTADINAGTMDGVQIGGTTATGELIVNNASDAADGLGSQGAAGQFLISQGAGFNPIFSSQIPSLSTTTFTAAASSGDITITAGNKYLGFLRITNASVDNEIIFLRFDNDSDVSDYSWIIDEQLYSTTPTSTLTGDDADSEIQMGTIETASVIPRMTCNFIFDADDVDNGSTNIVGIFGQCSGNSSSGTVTLEFSGFYRSDGTLNSIEFHVGSGTFTGNVKIYEFYSP